jgi:hypothetical protein
MKNGSKTVKIKAQEVMLKNKSFYKSSPLGDEAATQGQGAGVITHTITGKTYFGMWSMDVKIEGQNADRHTDITTSNHQGQMPGNESVPLPNAATMASGGGEQEEETEVCECCGGDPHSAAQTKGEEMSEEEFYTPVMGTSKKGKVMRPGFADEAEALLNEIRAGECENLLPPKPPGDDPCSKYYKNTPMENKRARIEFEDYKYNQKAIEGKQIAHRVPLNGGGCPVGSGNHSEVQPQCLDYEVKLGRVQERAARYHRKP